MGRRTKRLMSSMLPFSSCRSSSSSPQCVGVDVSLSGHCLQRHLEQTDPQFLSTLDNILLTPKNGGLTANGLVYRYDASKTPDGPEGTFSLCTMWCVEALARAGQYDKARLDQAVTMFEDFLQYGNHVNLYTEEISPAGDA
ncbi:glycoside hydrolase family 15 protein [Trametes sanguinea]|nr:glycoside hydrolase family 15 protein [Trametes sanguinea]